MRIAICQPTYLPWLGYFDLMDQVDAFVLLDNVQFEKQSWQQRNRIKTPTGLQWLTVPVVFRGRLGQMIRDVEIREVDFGKTHLRAIELNYGRTRFFTTFFPQVAPLIGEVAEGMRLADLNLRLLQWITGILGIRTELLLASSLGVEGKRTKLLSEICQKLGAKEYVSPIGSANYLVHELRVLNDAEVDTFFHNYVHPEYEQRFPPFLPFASVIDLIFNEGTRATEIIRSGRQASFTAEFVATRMAEAKEA
ncbi:MAG TPA: WbqC family protein [Candidatus Sulfotelmatobacter sp.]|nr:WbqC family protein [Candidatus Sulfotelmatobacter sp.]